MQSHLARLFQSELDQPPSQLPVHQMAKEAQSAAFRAINSITAIDKNYRLPTLCSNGQILKLYAMMYHVHKDKKFFTFRFTQQFETGAPSCWQSDLGFIKVYLAKFLRWNFLAN